MRLEDHRLKQARCNSERFQVSRTEFCNEGKCLLPSLVGYMSGEVAGRDVDHDDDDDDNKKGQWNRN